MSKHTEGPWRVVHDEPYEVSIEYAGRRVPGVKIWLDDACFDTNAERLANARLIAAAPELLDACDEALSDQEILAPGIRNDAVIERLRAAIAKATGGGT